MVVVTNNNAKGHWIITLSRMWFSKVAIFVAVLVLELVGLAIPVVVLKGVAAEVLKQCGPVWSAQP